MRALLFGIAALLPSLGACGKSSPDGLSVGGLYSIKDESDYKVVKILATDGGRVHVRIYKNKFSKRPETVDPSVLSLGAITDKDGFGIGHLPLDRATFDAWMPRIIMQTAVTEEELEGYRMWKESGGGAFK